MIQDQMTLFAAPAAQTESPPSGHKQARKPARARTRAADEPVAAPLALPLVTPACELRDETAATFSRLGATAPNIPTRRPSTPSLEATPPMPETTDTQPPTPAIDDAPAAIRTDRLWQLDGWTARVIKNQDDDGWAVEMLKDGEAEPALVGPWTMGRDKKNPKPLDVNAFNTLVKTASEVLRRHEQQLHAQLNKNVTITTADGQRLRVALAIVPDEEGATATLSAQDELGEELARAPAPPTFKLTAASALAWVESGFERRH